MNHVTSIGLDVHSTSVTAAAFNPFTAEVVTKSFPYSAEEIAAWALAFESPSAAYESGVTGFDLARKLNALGLPCEVAAVSKLPKSTVGKRMKNDRNDAVEIAKAIATHTITPVMIPDSECESLRNLCRAHDDLRQELARAKQRLSMFLMRHGHVFNEVNAAGQKKSKWTRAHWEWIRSIEFPDPADEDVYALYISEVRHMEAQKKQVAKYIEAAARKDRWRGRVEALSLMLGIDTLTAFTLTVEADLFSRFASAPAFEAWTGLVPSEHISNGKGGRGGVNKCGNALVRRILVEAAWHYASASPNRKRNTNPDVPIRIENHAHKGTVRLIERRRALKSRGKKPVVANCATARELAGWVWAVGCMCEGSM